MPATPPQTPAKEAHPVSGVPLIDEPIALFKPFHGQEEIDAVAEVIRSGWWGNGPKTVAFEEAFAAFVGARYGVSTNSATAALHLALTVADVAGGEVLTTPITFVSTNHVILLNNGTPVFCDVERDTLNIDPDDIARKVTPRTKAIVCVHYGGHPCDMERIHAIAKTHNLIVIEDAAHAAGSRYKDQPIGSLSPLTCFSFHPVKNLATGDGGMVTLDNPEWRDRLNRLRWVGINKNTWQRSDGQDSSKYSWEYGVDEIGYKYHSNDLMSAIALVQLGRLPATNARRRAICAMYDEGLAGLGWLETPVEKDYAFSARHNYVIKTRQRDKLADWLKEHRIASGMHYIPNHLYPMYKPYVSAPLPVTESVWLELLTLPLHPNLSDDDVAYIIDVIRHFPYA